MSCPHYVETEKTIGDLTLLVCRDCGAQLARVEEPNPTEGATSTTGRLVSQEYAESRTAKETLPQEPVETELPVVESVDLTPLDRAPDGELIEGSVPEDSEVIADDGTVAPDATPGQIAEETSGDRVTTATDVTVPQPRRRRGK